MKALPSQETSNRKLVVNFLHFLFVTHIPKSGKR
jgi:hypothetical protein